MANAYDYAPKYRPASFCTLPAGWDMVAQGRRDPLPLRSDLPMSEKPFGIVRYRRPLSEHEIENYELEPC